MQKESNKIEPNAKEGKVSYVKLWQDVKKHKKYFFIVLPVAFIIAAFLALSVPNYYNCTVKLAPELSMSNTNRARSLSNLASSLGINLSTTANNGDALFPTLYPELMNSVTFRVSLFPITVQKVKGGKIMTYYDYLKDEQKTPWWSKIIPAIMSIFKDKKEDVKQEVDIFKLTREQSRVAKMIAKKVVCDVDNKTFVITINVTDQDPLIAATIADSVQQKLQMFITDYRTRKARVDLEHNQKIRDEAYKRYEQAMLDYANYSDANQHVFLESVRSKQNKLQTELSIQTQAYTQAEAQVMTLEAKVQEETPAFTTLQPATVPLKKSGPKRAQICLIFLFLAFIGTTLYCFHKEGDLIPMSKMLLGLGSEEDAGRSNQE